jgi:hypothetical protein
MFLRWSKEATRKAMRQETALCRSVPYADDDRRLGESLCYDEPSMRETNTTWRRPGVVRRFYPDLSSVAP